MTWVLWIWSIIIVIWMVAGGVNADCGGESACQAGTGIGIAIIALIGFFGFAFLSIIWFMTRPKEAR